MGSPHLLTAPIRRLGQNFLVDQSAARRLVSSAELTDRDIVLEVGAGYGNLTSFLIEEARVVIAVEKDPRLVTYLRKRFANDSRVQVLQGDFLKMELPRFDKVVSTPPYYISSKLILRLLGSKFIAAVLALQREFAERLAAEPGGRDYGRLTVMLRHAANIDLLDVIPRASFRPIPKVDSQIVKIIPKKLGCTEDHKIFEALVRELFNQRRRKVSGPLRKYFQKLFNDQAESAMNEINPPPKRVYELTPDEFKQMASRLDRFMSSRDRA